MAGMRGSHLKTGLDRGFWRADGAFAKNSILAPRRTGLEAMTEDGVALYRLGRSWRAVLRVASSWLVYGAIKR